MPAAHQIPSGDLASIIERAIDLLFKKEHKRKTGITNKPRKAKSETKFHG